ncbi:hypothetical protein [Adlercreutzia sp. ZJ141]|uniref:hypothetical protein n=1 Tax=Adlercreutzia sp. ZJ141 TaxID=2709406 RepID=UPI0013EE1AF5|nr:hypothetical protein [Adlercreutzia sp. ZJ141]
MTQKTIADIEQKLIIDCVTGKFNSNVCNGESKTNVDELRELLEELGMPKLSDEQSLQFNRIFDRQVVPVVSVSSDNPWYAYGMRRSEMITAINGGALTQYSPVQIGATLEKLLKSYSMLEIRGLDGYRTLKRASNYRWGFRRRS